MASNLRRSKRTVGRRILDLQTKVSGLQKRVGPVSIGENAVSTASLQPGAVGGWVVDSNAIYSGTKSASGSYAIANSITIGSSPNGYISATKFRIDANGDAFFQGAINGGTIDIGGSDPTSFHVDADGNMWLGAGTIGAATFKVTNAGVLSATGASVSGTITTSALTATGGTIGGWTITSNVLEATSSNRRVQLIKSIPPFFPGFYENESYWEMPAVTVFDSVNTQAVGYFGTYTDNLVSIEGRTGETFIEIDNDGLDSINLQINNSSTSSATGIHLATFTTTSVTQGVWLDGYTGTGTRALYVTDTGRITTSSSDITLKEDINPLESVIDKVLLLNPVTFYWKDKLERGMEKQTGLIAQELEQFFPELVQINLMDDKKTILSEGLIFILIKAIQELNDKLDSLTKE